MTDIILSFSILEINSTLAASDFSSKFASKWSRFVGEFNNIYCARELLLSWGEQSTSETEKDVEILNQQWNGKQTVEQRNMNFSWVARSSTVHSLCAYLMQTTPCCDPQSESQKKAQQQHNLWIISRSPRSAWKSTANGLLNIQPRTIKWMSWRMLQPSVHRSISFFCSTRLIITGDVTCKMPILDSIRSKFALSLIFMPTFMFNSTSADMKPNQTILLLQVVGNFKRFAQILTHIVYQKINHFDSCFSPFRHQTTSTTSYANPFHVIDFFPQESQENGKFFPNVDTSTSSWFDVVRCDFRRCCVYRRAQRSRREIRLRLN